ncbi:uncharacterized protein TrAFT101_010607 [Trichoderma asperellum]|uniref:Uncharacterized protein n=1 Tax=Trichoderma asperellum (strain ATCC 204424 / CBS 433.97 / NBRC 101777) TaxID=1042311 RepID=A0A2T3YT58_TRIA4|nr:hypothetical protein M441DRAFT_204096 [Trichoderma asperellum CBS 433.97]PTB35761.1 hypothetical protein M441DRAFT_204096 [Trichoderma asperellum CBS 433.97]UKZ95793.1 hypothetical protein TrAFT101_010607 [Trichoderma asperellum]
MFAPVQRITKSLKPQTVVLGATLVFAAVASGTYSFRIYNRYIRKYQIHIRPEIGVSDSLTNSNIVRTLVNPHSHVAMGDSRSVVLTTHSGQEAPSDEAILSALVNGFFSGPVFTPERIALRLLGLQLVKFEGLAPTSQHIWNTSQMPNTHLPAKTAILWGCFQVANIELSSSTYGDNKSIIDIVFGNNKGQFAGCHRFSIKRLEAKSHSQREPTQFHIQLECIVCNPTVNKPIGISFLGGFHIIYANMLFRDAVTEAKHRLSLSSA